MARDKKKKRQRRDVDEYGSIDVPYDTQRNTMEQLGIHPIRGRSDRSRTIESWLYRGIAVALVGTACFVTFSSCDARSSVKNMDSSIEKLEDDPSFTVRYPELGASIIRAYYAGNTPPVNLMSTVVWNEAQAGASANGGKAVTVSNLGLSKAPVSMDLSPSSEQGSIFTKPRMETLTYVGEVEGKYYQFSVNLIVPNKDNPTVYPYLAEAPTMEPLPMFVQSQETMGTPEGVDGFSKSDGLAEDGMDALSRWAIAFAGDDRNELKSLTGDDNPDHVYYGLGGYLLRGQPIVNWAYTYDASGGAGKETFTYARVSFNIEQTGSTSGGKLPFTQTQTMDILLSNQKDSTPRILAWGPAGSWTRLKQEMNAASSSDVQNNIAHTEVPAAGSSSSTSTTANPGRSGSNARSVPGAPTVSMTTSTERTSTKSTSKKSASTAKRPSSSSSKKAEGNPKGSSEKNEPTDKKQD